MLDSRLPTVSLRMNRQSKNAQRVAEALHGHKRLTRVIYPTLFDDAEQLRIFRKQCEYPGAIFSIEFKGGKPAAFDFLRHVRIARNAVSLGGVETLTCHPKTTTHSGMSAEELAQSGVTDGLVRISVGRSRVALVAPATEDPSRILSPVQWGRHFRLPDLNLSHPRHIRRHSLPVFRELRAKARGKKPVFRAHADLRAGRKNGQGGEQPRPGRLQQTRSQRHRQQACINGMPHDRIGTAADQLVIVIKPGLNAKLPAQVHDGGPHQNVPGHAEDQRRSQQCRRRQ